MKKRFASLCAAALALALALTGCGGNAVTLTLPFDAADIERVELYHFDGAPSAAEKKTVTGAADLESLHALFEGLSLQRKDDGRTAGASVTSFRFRLTDGTDYELIYTGSGAKDGLLIAAADDFQARTAADIGWYWTHLDYQATAADETELPVIDP